MSRAPGPPSDPPVGPSSGLGAEFLLDRSIAHLNHGGFGACPRPVFEAHQRWQRRLEAHPSALLSHGHETLTRDVRGRLAAFLDCSVADLVLTQNTTAGLNAVARSLALRPGDEVLATDHEYEAMNLLWEHVCARGGARYVRRPLALPATTPAEYVDALFAGVTPATRVIFCSHITSKTAVLLPVEEICRRARAAGIMTIVDGAHAVGQIPLRLTDVGADVYAASCHKWLCAPRGTGFLHVRPEHQDGLLAPLISHGSGGSFAERYRWQGTGDPSAYLALPDAIDFHGDPRWGTERRRCHALARRVRRAAGDLFGLEPTTPDTGEWFAHMVALPLPPCDEPRLRGRLLEEHRVDVPVNDWNGTSLLRVSVQAYNSEDDLERLLDALRASFGTHRGADL